MVDEAHPAVTGVPVDPDSPSNRFMGFVPVFEEAGFREMGRIGTRRYDAAEGQVALRRMIFYYSSHLKYEQGEYR